MRKIESREVIELKNNELKKCMVLTGMIIMLIVMAAIIVTPHLKDTVQALKTIFT